MRIWESRDNKLEVLWWIFVALCGLLWVSHAMAIILITLVAFFNAIQLGRLS
jgi:hypothetical protein